MMSTFFSDSMYILVQRNPPNVKGPYLNIQLAKNELKEMAKNGGSRMMLEFIHGAINGDPHLINGISQVASNGFDTDWRDWDDINAMVAIVDQHLGKNTDYQSLCKVDHSLRLNKLFKKTCIKSTFYQGGIEVRAVFS